MIIPPTDVSWLVAAGWLVGLFAVGFAVSWLATDVGGLRRGPYVLLLTVVTLLSAGAYLAWVGVGVAAFVTHQLWWGVLGGLVVTVPVARGITRLPATTDPGRRRAPSTAPWDGAVYGFAEGVLLSALPALVAWHAAASSGWTGTRIGTVGAGALALAASAVMIAVHHFGYWDYRNLDVVPVVFGCSLLTLMFLLTGSVLAPVIGHIGMHLAGIRHGVELPPHPHGQRLRARPA